VELSIVDEGLHPHGPEDNWQESWAIGWYDRKSGLGGNHRASNWANRNNGNLWCGVFHGREKIFRLNMEDQPMIRMPAGVYGIQSGPQRLFHDGEHLRMQVETPECSVDLILDDFKDSVEKFDDGGDTGIPIYKCHFNMHFACRGTVLLNGVRHEIQEGLGWRDHSWGPRDYTVKPGHRSFHGNFGPDLNFHLLIVLTPEGKIHRRGHLVRNGQVYSFDTFTIRVEMLEDCVTPTNAKCHVFLDGGEKLTFSTDIVNGLFAQVQVMQGFFGGGTCSFTDSDGRTRDDGYCYFEVTNNPRLGDKPMPVALANTLTNGYYEADIPKWMYERL
jgi:hypothetical protein